MFLYVMLTGHVKYVADKPSTAKIIFPVNITKQCSCSLSP